MHEFQDWDYLIIYSIHLFVHPPLYTAWLLSVFMPVTYLCLQKPIKDTMQCLKREFKGRTDILPVCFRIVLCRCLPINRDTSGFQSSGFILLTSMLLASGMAQYRMCCPKRDESLSVIGQLPNRFCYLYDYSSMRTTWPLLINIHEPKVGEGGQYGVVRSAITKQYKSASICPKTHARQSNICINTLHRLYFP